MECVLGLNTHIKGRILMAKSIVKEITVFMTYLVAIIVGVAVVFIEFGVLVAY